MEDIGHLTHLGHLEVLKWTRENDYVIYGQQQTRITQYTLLKQYLTEYEESLFAKLYTTDFFLPLLPTSLIQIVLLDYIAISHAKLLGYIASGVENGFTHMPIVPYDNVTYSSQQHNLLLQWIDNMRLIVTGLHHGWYNEPYDELLLAGTLCGWLL